MNVRDEEFRYFLQSVDSVKDFVNVVSGMEGDVTISSRRYIINAKSIMGIFSLEFSKPMRLEIENWKDEYMEILKSYIAI